MTSFPDLHLTAPIAAALERLGWNANESLVKQVIPPAARGHNLIAVTPPAPVYATPALAGLLSRLAIRGRGLLLAPPAQLDEWGVIANGLAQDTAIRIQVAHGTSRVSRQLRNDGVDLIVTSPETAVVLATRSVLRTENIDALFLAWPDAWLDQDSITPLMQDLPKEAQRIIHTSSSAHVGGLSERFTKKALAVGMLDDGGPIGPIRTVSVSWSRRVASLPELVELLDPASLVVWTADRSRHGAISLALPVREPAIRLATGDAPTADIIIAFDLPTPERLRQLESAGDVVLLVPPEAESYVRHNTTSRRPIQLPSPLDAALASARDTRTAIVQALENGAQDRAILTLAPLFERYDAIRVAGALYELWSGSAKPAPQPVSDVPATAKIFVGVGKRDGVTANDLVGVLTKELRVDRTMIGRIELREAYSLIEIPASVAEKVAGALNGVTVRRKRITARVDRGPRVKGPRPIRR